MAWSANKVFYEVATRTCQNPSLSSKSVSTMSSDSESSVNLLKVSIGSRVTVVLSSHIKMSHLLILAKKKARTRGVEII